MTGPMDHIERAVDLFVYLLALCGISILLCHFLRRMLEQWNKPLWPVHLGALLASSGAALNLLALMLVMLVKLGLGFEPPLEGLGALLGELALLALVVLILRRDYRRLF